jgi:hypothetical protein
LPDADADDRVVAGVRIREEQVQLALPELALDGRQLLLELPAELDVIVRQVLQLDQVLRPLLQPLPGGDLLTELRSLAAVAPGLRRVVPDPGLG